METDQYKDIKCPSVQARDRDTMKIREKCEKKSVIKWKDKDKDRETELESETKTEIEGHRYIDRDVRVFLVRDNCVFSGPLGRSLHLFVRTAYSAHLFCSAPLRYARFACSLCSRSCSLPHGMVEISEYVFTL